MAHSFVFFGAAPPRCVVCNSRYVYVAGACLLQRKVEPHLWGGRM
jgi:hypothetical protein